jgi:hypothetical protein
LSDAVVKDRFEIGLSRRAESNLSHAEPR